MKTDIFEKEDSVVRNGKEILQRLKEDEAVPQPEYALLLNEYERLLKQLKRITRMSDLVTDNLNVIKHNLSEQVKYDSLTGIYSRRHMEERLYQLFAMLSKRQERIAVLMVDIDFFKRFNDTYGHRKGDECLKIVAGALKEGIGQEPDFVARYGGEEFLIALPHADYGRMQETARRVIESVRGCGIVHSKNDAAGVVTVSAGGVCGCVTDRQAYEEFIRLADEALYESKHKGRDRYTLKEYGRRRNEI